MCLWPALLATLWITQRHNPDPTSLRDALRLLSDVILLLRRLAVDSDIVALALQSVVHRASPDALVRHWPGTSAGLMTVHRLARLPTPDAPDAPDAREGGSSR